MFLKRSLASLARAYKLHVYDVLLCRYIWGLAPPPPYQKAFAHQKSGQMNSVPPHSLHEIAATAMDCGEWPADLDRPTRRGGGGGGGGSSGCKNYTGEKQAIFGQNNIRAIKWLPFRVTFFVFLFFSFKNVCLVYYTNIVIYAWLICDRWTFLHSLPPPKKKAVLDIDYVYHTFHVIQNVTGHA